MDGEVHGWKDGWMDRQEMDGQTDRSVGLCARSSSFSFCLHRQLLLFNQSTSFQFSGLLPFFNLWPLGLEALSSAPLVFDFMKQ